MLHFFINDMMQFGKLLQFHNYKSYLKRNNLKELNVSGIRIETLRESFPGINFRKAKLDKILSIRLFSDRFAFRSAFIS